MYGNGDFLLSSFSVFKGESEIDVTYDQVWWPILRICALHLTHPKYTHSSEHTHTVNTHPEQWAAIYAAAPIEQLGVERALYIHSPHRQFLPAETRTRKPYDYESDSLTIIICNYIFDSLNSGT